MGCVKQEVLTINVPRCDWIFFHRPPDTSNNKLLSPWVFPPWVWHALLLFDGCIELALDLALNALLLQELPVERLLEEFLRPGLMGRVLRLTNWDWSNHSPRQVCCGHLRGVYSTPHRCSLAPPTKILFPKQLQVSLIQLQDRENRRTSRSHFRLEPKKLCGRNGL